MTENETPEKSEPARCERCGNWTQICGHDIPFAERIKSIAVDRTSLRVK